MFVSPGNDPNSADWLTGGMVGAPFTEAQQEYIYNKVRQFWHLDPVMNSDDSRYISYVLLHTVYIRIYQIFMGLQSFEDAEKWVTNVRVADHYNNSNGEELL